MSEFQKIKVLTNQQEFNISLAIYQGRIEFYQKAVNLIINVIPTFVFEATDLKVLFDNPKLFLMERVLAESTKIGDLELDKEKVFDLLAQSVELKGIVTYVNSLKSHNITNQSQSNAHAYTNHYEINSENEVILKQSTFDYLESSHSIFVTTQRQKDAFDSLNIIHEELKKLKASYGRSHIKFIEENFLWSYDGNIQSIEYKYLHSLE